MYVDGLAVGDVGESLLTERRILGDEGFIAVTVVVDSVTGKVVGGPTVSAKGFSEDPAVFDEVVPLITEALDRAARTASPTLTNCTRSSAAPSAAGSTTAIAAAR